MLPKIILRAGIFKTHPRVSDDLDAVLLSSLFDRPLPIDLDAVDDAILVQVVHGRGQVVKPVFVGDEAAEGVSREVVPAERGHDLQGRVLRPEDLEVVLSA